VVESFPMAHSMESDSPERGRLLGLLFGLPWFAVAGVYLEACAVRITLSRWPRPMGHDSYNAAIELFHISVWLLLVCSAITTPFVIVLAGRNGNYRAGLAAFVLAFAFISVLYHYDPGHIWAWFLD